MSSKIEQYWLFHCGYFKTPGALFVGGAGLKVQRLPMMAALVVHADHGPILIDAPFGPEGPSNAGEFLGALMRKSGVVFKDEWAIVPRIEQLGFRASEINHVLMTHLHFDHTGGMKSVAHARFYIDRDEWMTASGSDGLEAARQGYVTGDFRALGNRVEKMDLSDATLANGWDIFGDGSIEAVPLRGHSVGHTGYRVHLDDRVVFHVGDAVYGQTQITHGANYGPFGKNSAASLPIAYATIESLRAYFRDHPETIFVNSHDFGLGESCMGGPRALHS